MGRSIFSDQGWVTFEPTKGFTNPTEFTSEQNHTAGKDGGSSAGNSIHRLTSGARKQSPKKETPKKAGAQCGSASCDAQ